MLQNWKFQKSFDLKKYHLISKCRFYYTVNYEIDLKLSGWNSLAQTIMAKMSWDILSDYGPVKTYFPVNFRSKLKIILEEKLTVLGLELGVKANLKTLSPRSQFQLWAQTELTLTDMTNKMKFHSLQLTSHAPTVPRIYGTLRKVFNIALWLAKSSDQLEPNWKLF